jgi:hypothetical protein
MENNEPIPPITEPEPINVDSWTGLLTTYIDHDEKKEKEINYELG